MPDAGGAQPPQPPNDSAPALFIGLGASAGGIAALKTFFANANANANATYVVILHLAPDHDSRLAEVLQGATSMPVTQVRERVRMQPNHVYVIPPNGMLGMDDGHVLVTAVD